MPLVVNKESIRQEILLAFQQCTQHKPLTKVNMREIAAQAGISHAKILCYFETKQQLILSYVDYVTDLYGTLFTGQAQKARQAEKRTTEQIHQFLADLVKQTIALDDGRYAQISALGKFDEAIHAKLQRLNKTWQTGMNDLLAVLYGQPMRGFAEVLLFLMDGILVYAINQPVGAKQVRRLLNALDHQELS